MLPIELDEGEDGTLILQTGPILVDGDGPEDLYRKWLEAYRAEYQASPPAQMRLELQQHIGLR